MKYLKEYTIACEAVFQACALASEMQERLESTDCLHKDDLSPVTLVDFCVQVLLNLHLSSHFPTDEIMGEEDSSFLRQVENGWMVGKMVKSLERFFSGIQENEILEAIDRGGSQGGPRGRFWVIDPIDGTKGFIRGEQYAVALALIENGEVVLGFLGCPKLVIEGREGVLFSAIKRQGVRMHFLEDQKEAPLPKYKSKELELIYTEPHESSKSHSHDLAYAIAKQLHAHPKASRLDSQSKYALVALNLASIYLRIPTKIHRIEKIWDHAAGEIIVEEAGGVVTDLFGKKLDYTLGKTLSANRGILVTQEIDHAKAVEASIHSLKT